MALLDLQDPLPDNQQTDVEDRLFAWGQARHPSPRKVVATWHDYIDAKKAASSWDDPRIEWNVASLALLGATIRNILDEYRGDLRRDPPLPRSAITRLCDLAGIRSKDHGQVRKFLRGELPYRVRERTEGDDPTNVARNVARWRGIARDLLGTVLAGRGWSTEQGTHPVATRIVATLCGDPEGERPQDWFFNPVFMRNESPVTTAETVSALHLLARQPRPRVFLASAWSPFAGQEGSALSTLSTLAAESALEVFLAYPAEASMGRSTPAQDRAEELQRDCRAGSIHLLPVDLGQPCRPIAKETLETYGLLADTPAELVPPFFSPAQYTANPYLRYAWLGCDEREGDVNRDQGSCFAFLRARSLVKQHEHRFVLDAVPSKADGGSNESSAMSFVPPRAEERYFRLWMNLLLEQHGQSPIAPIQMGAGSPK